MVALTDVPYKFSGPWAQDAATGYVNTHIPVTAASPAASQQLGFPPATATPIGAGGTPPNIADFNGLALYLTAWALWLQAGGPIQYDGTFSGSVNGYPKGALLLSTSLPGHYWVNFADNNTTDPDGGSPANWQNLFSGLFGVVAQGPWVNVPTNTRTFGTVYTNTTGCPMQVSVTGISTGSGANLVLLVDNMSVFAFGQPLLGAEISVCGIVPAGATYEVTNTIAGVTLQLWTEYTQA